MLVALNLVISAWLLPVVFNEPDPLLDLNVYREALEFVRHGGGLYDYFRPHEDLPGLWFVYPPFAALLMSPLTWWPLPETAYVVTVFNLALAPLTAAVL